MAPVFSSDSSEGEDNAEDLMLQHPPVAPPAAARKPTKKNKAPSPASSDEEDESPPPTLPAVPKASQPAKPRKTNFTVRDDTVLSQAWIKVSEDGVKGKDQKSGLFWNSVTEFFNDRMTAESGGPRTYSSLNARWATVRQSAKIFLLVDKKHAIASGENLSLHRAKVVKAYNEFVEKKKKEQPTTKVKPVKPEDGDAYYALYVEFLGTKVKFANPAKQGIERPTKGNRALVSSQKARKKARAVMNQCGIPAPVPTVDSHQELELEPAAAASRPLLPTLHWIVS